MNNKHKIKITLKKKTFTVVFFCII